MHKQAHVLRKVRVRCVKVNQSNHAAILRLPNVASIRPWHIFMIVHIVITDKVSDVDLVLIVLGRIRISMHVYPCVLVMVLNILAFVFLYAL